MAASFWLWSGVERPAVLIADNGSLVGVLTDKGRALSKSKGAGFVARNWLENDGDGAQQWQAAERWDEGGVIHLSGKRALAAFKGCAPGEIVITSVKLEEGQQFDCPTFDPSALRLTGSIALRKEKGGWHMTTARDLAGERLWTQWPEQQGPTSLGSQGDQYVRINPTSKP